MKTISTGFLLRKSRCFTVVFFLCMLWLPGGVISCGLVPNSAGCYDYCSSDSACKKHLYCWKDTCIPLDCKECYEDGDTCEFFVSREYEQQDETPTSQDSSADWTVSGIGECEFLTCGSTTQNFTLKNGCHHYSQVGHVICVPSF